MYKFDTSPAYSIPKSNRKNLNDNENVVGPGQYQKLELNTIKQNTQKTVFGKSLRQNQKIDDTPGPGLYQTQGKDKVKGSYFTKKYNDGKEKNSIGPGSYNVEKSIKKSKGVIFATAKNNQQQKGTSPGPGDYYKPELYTDFKRSNKNATFNNSPRMKQSVNNAPGPGQYEIQTYSKIPKKQTFTKTSRLTLKKDFDPGYIYDTFIKNLSNKGGYISKQQYDNKKSQSQIPFYNNQSLYHKKFKNNSTGKFGKAQRDTSLLKNVQTPGVGQYNIENSKKNKGVTFSKNFSKYKSNNIPGPGQYDNKLEAMPKKGFKFNKFINSIRDQGTPGPGSYDFFKTFKKNQTFSKQQRDLHKENQTPGPGTYQYQLQEKVKMGVIPKDEHAQKIENQPGPADYKLPPTILLVAPYSLKR